MVYSCFATIGRGKFVNFTLTHPSILIVEKELKHLRRKFVTKGAVTLCNSCRNLSRIFVATCTSCKRICKV